MLAEKLLSMYELEYSVFSFMDDMDIKFNALGSELVQYKSRYENITNAVDDLRDRFYVEVNRQMKAKGKKLGSPVKKKMMYESVKSDDLGIKKIYSNWARNTAQMFKTKLKRGNGTNWLDARALIKVVTSLDVEGMD